MTRKSTPLDNKNLYNPGKIAFKRSGLIKVQLCSAEMMIILRSIQLFNRQLINITVKTSLLAALCIVSKKESNLSSIYANKWSFLFYFFFIFFIFFVRLINTLTSKDEIKLPNCLEMTKVYITEYFFINWGFYRKAAAKDGIITSPNAKILKNGVAVKRKIFVARMKEAAAICV